MKHLRLTTMPLLAAAALLPMIAQADPVCDLGSVRQRSAIRELCPVKDGLARIQINGAWGVVHADGKLAIAPQFEALQDFSEGYAAAQQGELWGLIDKQGQWVVKPSMEELGPVSNGLASATIKGQTGYIDASGKWVIAPQYLVGGDFGPAVAVAKDHKGNALLIDRSGRVIKRFASEISVDGSISRTGLFSARVDMPTMLVNVDGRRLPFPDAGTEYKNGTFVASAKIKKGKEEISAYGLIDTAGKWLLAPQFRSLEQFEDKLAVASPLAADKAGEMRYGLVDRNGKFIVKPIYAQLRHLEGVYTGDRAGSDGARDVFDASGRLLFTYNCENGLDTEDLGPLTAMSGCGQTWLVHAEKGLLKQFKGDWEVDARARHLLLSKRPVAGEDGGLQFELYNEAGQRVAGSDPAHPVLGRKFHSILLLSSTVTPRDAQSALPLAYLASYDDDGGVALITRDYKVVTRPDWRYDNVLQEYITGEYGEGPLVMKGPEGFGAVDTSGNWAVAPQYQELGMFGAGFSIAVTTDDKVELVGVNGKVYPVPQDIEGILRPAYLQLTGRTGGRDVSMDLTTGKITPMPGKAGDDAEQDAGEERRGASAGGLTPVQKDDQWGLKNASGAWVLAPSLEYEPKPLEHKDTLLGWSHEATGESGQRERLIGLLDPQGRVLHKPRFSRLEVDDETGLLMAMEGSLHSVLGANGKPVLAPVNGKYDSLGDGWFRVDMEDLNGLLDQRGEWALKPGPVEIRLDTPSEPHARPYAIEGKGAARQLIDFTGRVSTAAAPLELKESEPSHWWWTDDPDDHEGHSVFRGFNFKPRVELPGKAKHSTFSEGVIAFAFDDPMRMNERGLADESGKVIGTYKVHGIDPMASGMARVNAMIAPRPGKENDEDGSDRTRYGYINRAGKLAVPVIYEDAAAFSEKRATVIISSGLAMIDDSGKIVLQGSWQCGRTPVLMDGRKNVLWPEEARKITGCAR